MKLDEHCIPTCIATTDIIPHDLMLKALIHNKRVAMKHSISERKLNFLFLRSLLNRGTNNDDSPQRCDGQNDIFVISVIDLESSSCDLQSVLMAPHCYLPIEDQSCVVINEAAAATTTDTATAVTPIVLSENGFSGNVRGSGQQQIVLDEILVDGTISCRREREWSSSSVDSFFCRCNIDTVFPEDIAAIQLGT